MGSLIKWIVFLLGILGIGASKKRKQEVKKIDKKVKQNKKQVKASKKKVSSAKKASKKNTDSIKKTEAKIKLIKKSTLTTRRTHAINSVRYPMTMTVKPL